MSILNEIKNIIYIYININIYIYIWLYFEIGNTLNFLK